MLIRFVLNKKPVSVDVVSAQARLTWVELTTVTVGAGGGMSVVSVLAGEKAAGHGTLSRRALEVQRQQLLQQFIVRDVGIPSVCLEHGLIQPAMRISQPRRPLVVEVRERSLLQFLRDRWN